MPEHHLNPDMHLDYKEFVRYNRHVMTNGIGEEGQLAIKSSHVIIIGLGGLGCPASQYLTASGVGTITLIDHDIIESSNLQRQVLFTEQDIGQQKVDIAQLRLQSLNPLIKVNGITKSILNINLSELLNDVDVVLDCTDNATTRHFINATCVKNKVKLVSASAIQSQGQLISFDFASPDSPCYQCVFPSADNQDLNCSTSGVFSPVLGVLGSLQATEALRLILGKTNNLNTLSLFDAWGMAFKRFTVTKDPKCICCH
ncbi:MAG: molybdopterin/thiamine biosynthesis adenylyltransferase [Psychrosphaera sp.]|jgi:molybdopterin/thiamine biosynthesis adenylyltransferase